jgi:hypothetical protein
VVHSVFRFLLQVHSFSQIQYFHSSLSFLACPAACLPEKQTVHHCRNPNRKQTLCLLLPIAPNWQPAVISLRNHVFPRMLYTPFQCKWRKGAGDISSYKPKIKSIRRQLFILKNYSHRDRDNSAIVASAMRVNTSGTFPKFTLESVYGIHGNGNT